MIEEAKEITESAMKLNSAYFEEDDKNVMILFKVLDATRMVVAQSSLFKIL